MRTQGEYAQWLNHTRNLPGHLWQGRFFSCTLDENHLLTALRYVESNPIRANLVADATNYRWSSASYHAGVEPAPRWLAAIEERGWTAKLWREWLADVGQQEQWVQLRMATRLGRPFASQDSVADWEACYGRRLCPRPTGRPSKDQGRRDFASAPT